MTIYECLGLEHAVLDQEISPDHVIDSLATSALRSAAAGYFEHIKRIVLRASFQEEDDCFQVLEVVLSKPLSILEISFLIQKAIKYRILFVFVYENRYLLLRRSFRLTSRTGNVHSRYISFCSDWLYDECFDSDFLFNQFGSSIAADFVSCVDASGTASSEIVFRNAEVLSNIIAESECVCVRWLIDWMKVHVAGQRIVLKDFIERIGRIEAYQQIGDHLFVDKANILATIRELENGTFTRPLDHTGKCPPLYFAQIGCPATASDAEAWTHALRDGVCDVMLLDLPSYDAGTHAMTKEDHTAYMERKHANRKPDMSYEDSLQGLYDWYRDYGSDTLVSDELVQEMDLPSDSGDYMRIDEDQRDAFPASAFPDAATTVYSNQGVCIELTSIELEEDKTLSLVFWINNQYSAPIEVSLPEVVLGKSLINRAFSFDGKVIPSGCSQWCRLHVSKMFLKTKNYLLQLYFQVLYLQLDDVFHTDLSPKLWHLKPVLVSEPIHISIDFDQKLLTTTVMDKPTYHWQRPTATFSQYPSYSDRVLCQKQIEKGILLKAERKRMATIQKEADLKKYRSEEQKLPVFVSPSLGRIKEPFVSVNLMDLLSEPAVEQPIQSQDQIYADAWDFIEASRYGSTAASMENLFKAIDLLESISDWKDAYCLALMLRLACYKLKCLAARHRN